MSHRLILIVLIAFNIVFLSGCGSNGSSSSSTESLIGTWVISCSNGNNGYSDYSYERNITFGEASSSIESKVYIEHNCNENKLEEHIIGKFHYTIGSKAKFSNGEDATELNLIFSKAKVAFSRDPLIDDSTDFSSTKSTLYTMYKIDGNRLYMSIEDDEYVNDGETAERRVNVMNNDYFVKR